MKSLLERLKTVPKKTLILMGLLVLLSISTLLMSAVVVKQATNRPPSSIDDEAGSVGAFNDSGGSSSQKKEDDTVEKIELDLTDVYGLDFVSRGDGTCYIAGIGTCTKTELEIPSVSPAGDKVTKISELAFENCKELVSISIPASVRAIGTGAFRGCEKLVAILVSNDNEVYSSVSGVLFSKDKSVLICYPMNRAGQNYYLNSRVTAIGAYAFEGAINLRQILYAGSIADFSSINVLTGNDILDSIAITCNYSGGK